MQKIPGRFMRESFRKLASALLPGTDLKMLTLTSPPRSGPWHAKAFTCHELLQGGSYHRLSLTCFRQAYMCLHPHYPQEARIFLNKIVSKSTSGWLTMQRFFYSLLFWAVLGLLLHAGFFQLQGVGATPCCNAEVSRLGGFSCCESRALVSGASVSVTRGPSSCSCGALKPRLSICGTQAELLFNMWDLPRLGI